MPSFARSRLDRRYKVLCEKERIWEYGNDDRVRIALLDELLNGSMMMGADPVQEPTEPVLDRDKFDSLLGLIEDSNQPQLEELRFLTQDQTVSFCPPKIFN
jgi:hypothetical protein